MMGWGRVVRAYKFDKLTEKNYAKKNADATGRPRTQGRRETFALTPRGHIAG